MKAHHAWFVSALVLGGCSFGSQAPAGEGPDAGSGNGPVDGAPASTVYPIVLAHGMFGFDHIGPLDYFYGVAPVLTAQGRQVFTPRVDPVQASGVRGPELMAAVDAALAATGASKVVIIGHSQGGLDARWVAHYAPDKVAAVVTIATPNHGTSIGDLMTSALPGVADRAADALINLIGVPVSRSDLEAQLAGFSKDGIAAYNAEITDAPGVAYFSIAGRSNLASDAAGGCATTTPFLATYNDSVDTMAVELSPMSAMMIGAALPGTEVQDGLVSVASAKWGTFLGCVPADHFDEVCQIANDPPGIGNAFDCHAFYGGLEQYLRAAGF